MHRTQVQCRRSEPPPKNLPLKALAHRALSAELEIGLLLPCNVIVYEEEGGSVVSILDPLSTLGVVDNPGLNPVAQEARARLEGVIASLANV